MTLPNWTTFVIFVAILVQFVATWVQAKRSGKSFRSAALPNALLALGVSIGFARELFKDIPSWIDDPLKAVALLLLLSALAGFLVQLKRYLKNAWHQQEKGTRKQE